jgi:hypothetical protein
MTNIVVPTKEQQVARLRAELGQLHPELVAKWSDTYLGMVLHDRKTDAARKALKTDAQRKAYAEKNYARIHEKLLKALELRSTIPNNAFEEPGVAEMMSELDIGYCPMQCVAVETPGWLALDTSTTNANTPLAIHNNQLFCHRKPVALHHSTVYRTRRTGSVVPIRALQALQV